MVLAVTPFPLHHFSRNSTVKITINYTTEYMRVNVYMAITQWTLKYEPMRAACYVTNQCTYTQACCVDGSVLFIQYIIGSTVYCTNFLSPVSSNIIDISSYSQYYLVSLIFWFFFCNVWHWHHLCMCAYCKSLPHLTIAKMIIYFLI